MFLLCNHCLLLFKRLWIRKADDEYFLCYTADFYIPKLNSKKQFIRALKFSNNDVEVVLGFKNRDGEILEDCIEENTNSTTKFSQID